MPQITISNALGHTVTMSGEYNDLVSYLMHMRLLVTIAEQRYRELGAYTMAERANQDWELLYNAINELRENQ